MTVARFGESGKTWLWASVLSLLAVATAAAQTSVGAASATPSKLR